MSACYSTYATICSCSVEILAGLYFDTSRACNCRLNSDELCLFLFLLNFLNYSNCSRSAISVNTRIQFGRFQNVCGNLSSSIFCFLSAPSLFSLWLKLQESTFHNRRIPRNLGIVIKLTISVQSSTLGIEKGKKRPTNKERTTERQWMKHRQESKELGLYLPVSCPQAE
jgi:hypothetical protein